MASALVDEVYGPGACGVDRVGVRPTDLCTPPRCVVVVMAAVVGVGMVEAAVVVGVGMVEAAAVASPRCNLTLLTPYAGAALFGVPAACLCAYARSANYGSYMRSPKTRCLFAVCGLPMPCCP
uniref:Bifunctional inhibitor/plant lipid transfer protein/seed storage helical domain-containing protein n=1 Tax=Oryza meridionalis TaxID=40149 RepID=A0A0E0F7R5_9ORYZ